MLQRDDGTRLYYKDWGSGRPVVFSHGWPLCSDAWEAQMVFLAERGYRCVAHDRRGHGRSSQPWQGNDMDTYADDLAALLEHLDLRQAVLVGHSTGGGEVARYLGRHGSERVAGAVLIGAVTPCMAQGLPMSVFDDIRAKTRADRAQFFWDLTHPFYGQPVSDGVRRTFWMQGMQAGFKSVLDCIKAFSETDFTEDLRGFGVPCLFLHGEADQIVPLDISARKAAALAPGSELKVYAGVGHGLCTTHPDLVNQDLWGFLQTLAP